MLKVIHLIPYDGIGGVESAARTMSDVTDDRVDFNLHYLFPAVKSRQQRASTFNPFYLLRCVREIIKEQPDLLIVSLWRSVLVGILVRFLRPRTRLVVFVHNSVDAHFIDYLVTRLATYLAHEVWLDSQGSADGRFNNPLRVKTQIISFLAHHIEVDASVKLLSPTFIFWGRLAAQKDLCRSIKIFSKVLQFNPEAKYLIIGPDGDEAQKVHDFIARQGLIDFVSVIGPRDFSAIKAEAKNYSFYLQTSRYEGMAMAVVEAMQLGLVPIVTPVGEIGSYCKDQSNAILVSDDDKALLDIQHILTSQEAYDSLRAAAMYTWSNKPIYKDSVLDACRRVLLLSPIDSGS